MTNETLIRILQDATALPRCQLEETARGFYHHTLDYRSALRESGHATIGELFFTLVEGKVAAGCVFYLRPDHREWDIHFWTMEPFRKQHFATNLFVLAVLPWLRQNGYVNEIILTEAIGGNASRDLLRKLGFVDSNGLFQYAIRTDGEQPNSCN